MAIELRHLRYFIAVAEELHFHRAARRLHVAQPALSQNIKRLEQELDAVLLRRSTRRVELTSAGAVFLDKARATIAMFDETIAAGCALGQGERGKIVVGSTPQVRRRFSHILHDFHREHPHVELEKREGNTASLLADVDCETVDVGVGFVIDRRESLSYRAIGEDHLMLVVPDRHRLATRPSASLHDLAEETLLVPGDPNVRGLHQLLAERCRAAGFEPRLLYRPTEHEEAFESVLEGLGVELLCWNYVSLLHAPGIRILPIVPEASFVIEVFWRTGEANPAAQRFVEIATGQPFASRSTTAASAA